MKLTIVESPFSDVTKNGLAKNLRYARAAVRDCINRGEAPIASHLLLTQPGILDDSDPVQRKAGIAAGFAWRRVADVTAVYQDLGISGGMEMGISDSITNGVPVVYRSLDGWGAA